MGEFSLEIDKRLKFWVVVFFSMLLFLAFLNTAWVSDDAYISFRAIRNFVDGYGPVWNLDERVQVYTHPLWFFLVSFFSFIVGDEYWASLAASFFCLFGVVLMALAIFREWFAVLTFLLFLSLSRFFVDYSSSGLENPLSHLFLCFIIFFWIRQKGECSVFNLFLGLLSAAMLVLNRMDLALLGLPVTLDLLWRSRPLGLPKVMTCIFSAALPLVGWLMFSFYYYGSPFPNTYFAKVSTGIDEALLIKQGLGYYKESFLFDPASLTLIVFSLFIGLRYAELRSLALSVLLYCIYVVSVGGDFMVGRFLSAPFLMSAFIVVLALHKKYFHWGFLFFIVPIFAYNLPSTILAPKDYENYAFSLNGVADERGYYYKNTGLRNNISSDLREEHVFASHGIYLNNNPVKYVESCNVGMFGYYSPRATYILDGYGLTDPFLSRLPALSPWRIGHFERPAPPDYYEVISGRKEKLDDENINKLLQDVFLVHRGELNQKGRLEAILRLNFGDWRRYVTDSDFVSLAIDNGKTNPYACRKKQGISLIAF